MCNIKSLVTAAMGLAVSTAASQAAIQLDLAGLTSIQFAYSSFRLVEPGSFQITSPETSSAIDDQGRFSTGPFSYGPISTDISGNMSAQVATPAGTTVTILDGIGGTLSGNVKWGTITTFANSGIGGISDSLSLNITGITYTHGGSGFQADLQSLADAQSANLNLSFQFTHHMDLTTLAALQDPVSTTYSASISAVPEPSTYFAGLSALGMLTLFSWRNRK